MPAASRAWRAPTVGTGFDFSVRSRRQPGGDRPGECSPAQSGHPWPDSPPQVIHGLPSASPGPGTASATHFRMFDSPFLRSPPTHQREPCRGVAESCTWMCSGPESGHGWPDRRAKQYPGAAPAPRRQSKPPFERTNCRERLFRAAIHAAAPWRRWIDPPVGWDCMARAEQSPRRGSRAAQSTEGVRREDQLPKWLFVRAAPWRR